MFVRQVKRRCSVRGCKCTDSFAISRNREVGGTVIICKGCLGAALGAIDDIDPKTKSNIPAIERTEAPSLFFNAQALGVAEAVFDEDAEQEQEQGGEPEAANEAESEDETESAVEAESENETENEVDAETEAESGDYHCPRCGKGFATERGLKAHMKHCTAPVEEA